MEIKNLIGLKIEDIHCSFSDYEYDGSIPLICSETIIQLTNHLLISVPTVYSNTISISNSVGENMNSIYEVGKKLSFNLNEFPFFQFKMVKSFDSNIIGQSIKSILLYDTEEELDEGFIELENGHIIGVVKMTPTGTPAGVKIFKNILDLEKLHGTNYTRKLKSN
jgi:hypothetical protein